MSPYIFYIKPFLHKLMNVCPVIDPILCDSLYQLNFIPYVPSMFKHLTAQFRHNNIIVIILRMLGHRFKASTTLKRLAIHTIKTGSGSLKLSFLGRFRISRPKNRHIIITKLAIDILKRFHNRLKGKKLREDLLGRFKKSIVIICVFLSYINSFFMFRHSTIILNPSKQIKQSK